MLMDRCGKGVLCGRLTYYRIDYLCCHQTRGVAGVVFAGVALPYSGPFWMKIDLPPGDDILFDVLLIVPRGTH